MAELSTKARDKLPASDFAGKDRSYPVEDKSHAANAKARATQQEKKGNLSASEHAKIVAKADKILKDGKLKKAPPKPKAKIPKDPDADPADAMETAEGDDTATDGM